MLRKSIFNGLLGLKQARRSSTDISIVLSSPDYKGKPNVNMWLVPWEEQLPSHELSEPMLTKADVQRAIDEYQIWFKNDELPRLERGGASPFRETISMWQFPTEASIYFSNSSVFAARNHKFVTKYLREEKLDREQGFKPERHGALGNDLAASHFIVNRGGRVRFVGKDEWIANYDLLPNMMNKTYKVEELDASHCKLSYYGLDNLFYLRHLRHLDVSSNDKLDDWAVDKLACFYRHSERLKTLNLANNPAITYRSIESLVRLPALELLIITGTPAAKVKHIELLIHLFNEVNPNCKIIC